MLVKLALFAAAGALLAMTATQIPPKANLAWQFDHSTDVVQVEGIVFDALQALASESPHGASRSTDLTGTASFACGMSDGPATLAHLQVENAPATWWIFRVEGAAPEDLDGRYPIKNSARSGTARLRVCDNALNCTHAAEGAIVVTGQRPGGFEGSVEYRLPNEALERRTFTATIEAANVVCP